MAAWLCVHLSSRAAVSSSSFRRAALGKVPASGRVSLAFDCVRGALAPVHATVLVEEVSVRTSLRGECVDRHRRWLPRTQLLAVSAKARDHPPSDLAAPAPLRFFFSTMQFHATTGCLVGLRTLSTQFVYLFIIQGTAFAMTLRRRNLVGHTPLCSLILLRFYLALPWLGNRRTVAQRFRYGERYRQRSSTGTTGLRIASTNFGCRGTHRHVLRDSSAMQPMWVPLWLLSTASVAALGYLRSHAHISDVQKRRV